ncbi:MAG: cellulase family glycosylhydrolase [Fibromonadales bacterium]|nr:cellulase family glycosylhydrolase [Fibromonadales bacterium]
MKIFVLAFLLLVSQALAGPVSHFGALERCGKNLCGKKTGTNLPIFFKGPSLYWSDGTGTPFYNLDVVDWFVDNMQIGVIRAAMAIKWYGNNTEPVNKPGGVAGYLQNNKEGQKAYIKKVIDAAIANDIYVIVDWHSHNAHDETNEAKTFFVEMANDYKGVPNIIWEVYNEPISASLSQVTNHANTIITALRSAGNTNLVIIGSPSYSKQPKEQAGDWGSKDNNVAFAFHFYAASHSYPNGDGIGTSAQNAMSAGNAVFGSEWGTVNYDGGGSSNAGASDPWTKFMDDNKISNCMWNASNLNEASSMFPTSMGSSTLDATKLTASGIYFKGYMDKNKWTTQIPSGNPKGNDVIFSVDDGQTVTWTGTQLGLDGTIAEVYSRNASIPVEVSKTDNSITYKADGSKAGKIVLIYKVTKGTNTIQSKITVNLQKRLPVVPDKGIIPVSRKAPTTLSIVSDLSVSDPNAKGVQLVSASVEPPTAGTATTSGNNIVFTPANNADGTQAILKYTVKNDNGNRIGNVTLSIQNFAPTIRSTTNEYAPSAPNTDPVKISVTGTAVGGFSGSDADGDPLKFVQVYKDPQYPGRLEKVDDETYTYYPEAGKIGKVTLLAVITDGTANSVTGRTNIKLTGSGTEINVTPPTSIPGVIDPEPIDPEPIDPEPPVVVYQFNNSKSIGLASIGYGKVQFYLARSGVAKLDVYSLSGKKLGSLLNGYQNAGSKQISLGSLNLQKGVYILRLSQDSQVKTLRVVN